MTDGSLPPDGRCDRRRFLSALSLLGLAIVSSSSRGADRDPRATLESSPAPGLEGETSVPVRRLAILEGRIHERRLVRAEIDLVMPGGRVAAWSWQREGGSSVPVAMVIPPGTTLEAMLVDDTGVPSRLRLELDMPTHGRAAPEGLFALELASERPPWLRGGRRGSDEVTPLAETLPHGDLTLFLELERQPSRIPVETAPTGSPQERSTENDHDV